MQKKLQLSDKIWAKQFSDMLNKQTVEPEGEGWLMFDELFKKSPLTKNQLQLWLAKKVKSGEIDKFRGSKKIEGQPKLTSCFWYRPKI